MLNTSVILEESASAHPEKTALISGSIRLTYRQLMSKVNQLAGGLKDIGIEKGDMVLMACPNLMEFPIVYFAVLKIGAVLVPVNILSKKSELLFYLTDTGAKAFVCFEGTDKLPLGIEGRRAFEEADGCEHFIVIPGSADADVPYKNAMTVDDIMRDQRGECETEITASDDTAAVLYTSGTTGKPKGAELTHQNLVTTAMNFRDSQQVTSEDVHLAALPLYHCYAQQAQMNCGFLAGSAIVLIERFDPDLVFKMFEQENVTLFAGVPTMYWALLNNTDASKYDMGKIARTLRLGMSGGAAMPVELLGAVEKRFGITILEAYGVTETAAAGTLNRPGLQRKIGSVGIPHWGIRMRVVDESMRDVPAGEPGELVVQGHCTMKGYYNNPEATAEAYRGGWLHTGDVAVRDQDGYFYIVGRLKDMIIRGGYNIYPREIEEKLMEHPDISLIAVIGVPDEQYGEEVKAYLVLNDGATTTAEDIIAWSKERMANYKYPRTVEIVESLPTSATGKILKKELRKTVLGDSDSA
jgi:long-chain acyl-CoA synthetase